MAKAAKKKHPASDKTVKPAKLKAPSRAARRPAAGEPAAPETAAAAPASTSSALVLDRLWEVVRSRRGADPAISHSARLLSRGVAKVAQKFGEEAVECLIEAVAGNRDALIGESADVLYHLLVLWVAAGLRPDQVWQELERREGISGVAEKASRARTSPLAFGLTTRKIP